jgi:hypothetical protein
MKFVGFGTKGSDVIRAPEGGNRSVFNRPRSSIFPNTTATSPGKPLHTSKLEAESVIGRPFAADKPAGRTGAAGKGRFGAPEATDCNSKVAIKATFAIGRDRLKVRLRLEGVPTDTIVGATLNRKTL